MEKILLIKFAELLNIGTFLDDLPEWIAEVQLKEGGVIFRIDSDDTDCEWYEITVKKLS